jgi:hypothetical protein
MKQQMLHPNLSFLGIFQIKELFCLELSAFNATFLFEKKLYLSPD